MNVLGLVTILCLGALTVSGDEPVVATCGRKMFFIWPERKPDDWTDNSNFCESRGLQLPERLNDNENLALINAANKTGLGTTYNRLWLGARTSRGSNDGPLVWYPSGYLLENGDHRFMYGEPNNKDLTNGNCINLYADSDKPIPHWNDDPCDTFSNYTRVLCQNVISYFPDDPNTC